MFLPKTIKLLEMNLVKTVSKATIENESYQSYNPEVTGVSDHRPKMSQQAEESLENTVLKNQNF